MSLIYKYEKDPVRNIPAVECSLEDLSAVRKGKFYARCVREGSDVIQEINHDVYLDGYVDDDGAEFVNIAIAVDGKMDKVIESVPAKDFFDNFMENTSISNAGNIYNNTYVHDIVWKHMYDIQQESIHQSCLLYDNTSSNQIVLFSSNDIPVDTFSGSIKIEEDAAYITIKNTKLFNKTIIETGGYFAVCPECSQLDAYIISNLYGTIIGDDTVTIYFDKKNWHLISYDKFVELNGGEIISAAEKEATEKYNTEDKYEIEW